MFEICSRLLAGVSLLWVLILSAIPSVANGEAAKEISSVSAVPVLYLNFDAGMGNVARDKSGNDYDCNCIGEPKWLKMKQGFALEFDGVDDMVMVKGEKINISSSASFTISLWIKPEAVQKSRYKIFMGGGRDWDAQTVSMTMRELYPGRGNRCPLAVDAGSWQMVAFTYDAGSKTVAGYLNGEPVSKSECKTDFGPAGGFGIGAGESGVYYKEGYFKGWIDEFKIYDRALAAGEIKNEYERLKDAFAGV